MMIKILVLAFTVFFSSGLLAKTISVVIPFSVGGPTDILWRYIEPHMNQRLEKHGIKLITDNVPGAGGAIAANKISATQDRLILGFFSPALAIAPAMNPSIVKYDSNSIKLVGYAGSTEMLLVSKLSLEELMEKCLKGKILFGTSNLGSTSHLLGTLVNKKFECKDYTAIPYKGVSMVYPDLIENRVDFLVDFAISAEPHIKSGKVNQLMSVNERFPSLLENWHVLISNSANNDDFKIIAKEFENLKKDKKFVSDLEKSMRIQNFSSIKDQKWLESEFRSYKEFIDTIK
jgi:tripartite-type tricarboxylate transporter receptor subunit TctC